VQRTIFSWGDDKELAAKHMPWLAGRTHDRVGDINNYLETYLANDPVTIFLHGRTLRELGGKKFAEELKNKQFDLKGKTLVLIPCGAANMYESKEFFQDTGQIIADELGATVYCAKGTVTVNSEGHILVANPAEKGSPFPVDYSDDPRRKVPKESEGWTRYAPTEVDSSAWGEDFVIPELMTTTTASSQENKG
jgi:hypothetical protein